MNGQSGGAGPPRKWNSEGSKGSGTRSRSNSSKRRGGNHHRDSMVTPGSAGGFRKGGGNGHYGFRLQFTNAISQHSLTKSIFSRSESKEFERSNSGFTRNNKFGSGLGSSEDISERIVFKVPQTQSPVRTQNFKLLR